MNHSELKETLVGAAVFILLAVLGALAYGRSPDPGGYEVKATFKRIDGLAEGSEVLMGGIRIGTVIREELNEHLQPVVIMRLDNAAKIPKDTAAAIHTDGLFGSKFITLDPGGSEEILKPGGSIMLTQDVVIVGELLELIISEGRNKRYKDAQKAAAAKEAVSAPLSEPAAEEPTAAADGESGF